MPLLGLRSGQHLPDEGMAPRIVDGVKVWVLPIRPFEERTYPVLGHVRRNGLQLRVRCECPNCGQEVPVGRLAQHQQGKACKEQAAANLISAILHDR